MPFTTRHASRRLQATDFPAGHGSRLSPPLKALLAWVFLLSSHLLPHTALAQQAGVSPAASASAAAPSDDPVARFLSDKGLLPSRRGGPSEEPGFDCSGFTRHVFENSVGLILPRRASEQARSPQLVPVQQQAELKPGDLVFFNTLRQTYWQQRYNGARRAPNMAPQATAPANN